jgi:DNA-binding transcriptional MocR family regulator
MNDLVHNYIQGSTAVKIAESIEIAIREGGLRAGEPMPTIRDLARIRHVSPATVAAAYQSLQSRGLLIAQGRRGTKVAHRPMHRRECSMPVPAGVRDLSDGNPDPALLPDFGVVLRSIDPSPLLYGAPRTDASLVRLVGSELRECGVAVGEIAVLGGAMDAIERVLTEHLRPGDRVAVEDPGFGNLFDLVMSRGLSLVPVAVDDEGPIPDELARACREGVHGLIVTPRAQTPTGAALSASRAGELRAILKKHPDILLIEDDHANLISDAALHCLHEPSRTGWVHIRSFAKPLNPDLRLAVMTGDNQTIHRVQDRMIVGCRWVSHILQRTAYALLSDKTVRAQLDRAAGTYTTRREALRDSLREYGLTLHGRSGLNTWLAVAAETATVRALVSDGWLVAPGERFRLSSGPGIRITVSTLKPSESGPFAEALAATLSRQSPVATV